MTEPFSNVYDDSERARAYASLAYPGTYSLAFRDIPALIGRHVTGTRTLDFGCGTGRSSRLLRQLGLDVVGVDISAAMLAEARRLEPNGDFRLVTTEDLGALGSEMFDLILCAFTFDNIPTDAQKTRSLTALRDRLAPGGRVIVIVSAPEIYVHEWTSFSTKDFPANRTAQDGERVQIVMLDVPDRRPVEDVLCSDRRYREFFAETGFAVSEMLSPVATGAEPIRWVNETRIAPWSIYVLESM